MARVKTKNYNVICEQLMTVKDISSQFIVDVLLVTAPGYFVYKKGFSYGN